MNSKLPLFLAATSLCSIDAHLQLVRVLIFGRRRSEIPNEQRYGTCVRSGTHHSVCESPTAIPTAANGSPLFQNSKLTVNDVFCILHGSQQTTRDLRLLLGSYQYYS